MTHADRKVVLAGAVGGADETKVEDRCDGLDPKAAREKAELSQTEMASLFGMSSFEYGL